jgi:hypothetical protein
MLPSILHGCHFDTISSFSIKNFVPDIFDQISYADCSNVFLTSKKSSVLSLTLSLYYLCCIGEAREKDISFIFP